MLALQAQELATENGIESFSASWRWRRRHCAIDANIGEVDSDDDIEVNEVDEE
ncbi:hypothetical protein PC128_g27850 [Phytophthora cactorum]|nr:hypothetical protein PC128_g27850 [Phytophthora cactorum]